MGVAMESNSVVCLLVVNFMADLPKIAVESILYSSDSNIVIGYLDESDIIHLPKHERIEYLLLDSSRLKIFGGSVYQDFDQDSFYSIVQLKWNLIDTLLKRSYGTLIYTDTDVCWVRNPIHTIENAFKAQPKTLAFVQSFTENIDEPRLCMGFAAFRVCQETILLVEVCSETHTKMASKLGRIGDDEVITEIFKLPEYQDRIRELPQSTFPLGNMINLYGRKQIFPGISSPKPYLFHANFVIGLRNKNLLLNRFLFHVKSVHFQGSFPQTMIILVKALRIRLSKIRKSLGLAKE
jgi:hypothetical protein